MEVSKSVGPIDRSTVDALRRMAVVAASFLVVSLATYLVPGLDRVRPWVKGEGVPVLRLFTRETHADLPEFEGGNAAAAVQSFQHEASRAPGHSATEGDMQEGGSPPPAAGPGFSIEPSEYADVQQGIENPSALDAFYGALRRTAAAEPAAITRVSHYGDSTIAADEITFTVRRKLQQRFGDAGHGFMLVARGTMHYLHHDIEHRESSGWQVQSIVERPLRNGFYGYGGVLAHGAAGEHSVFATVDKAPVGHRASRFELYYQRFPGGGDVRLSVDGTPVSTVSTRSATVEDAWQTVNVPDGKHLLSLRTFGNDVRLYGVVQERDVPGVVYDSVGLVGARAERLLGADPEHMARQIAHRNPDLLVLGFGGNEAGNEWLDPERYERELTKVVKLMRAGKPAMSCLLFAPLDQGERNSRGDLVTLSVLPQIVEAQRRVARTEGCAFFDTFHAMGGPGSVARWFHRHPRLISSDFRHATPAGYQVIANLYYQALIKGFAEYLAKLR
jgi:lysophospholipase L1-like esterase